MYCIRRCGALAITVTAAVTAATEVAAAAAKVDVFTKGEAGYYCVKIPSLLTLQSGTLLAFGEGRYGSCSDYTQTDIVYKRSLDGGVTWGPLLVVHGELGAVIGNSAPVQLRGTGRIVLPFCKNNLVVMITASDDDGLSWSPPRNVSNVTRADWMWVGTGPPSSLQLTTTGRIITPSYHSVTPNDNGDFSIAHTMLSDDGGATWRLAGSFDLSPNYPNENSVVELPDTSLWSNARGLLVSRVGATSWDDGESWGNVSVIDALEQPLVGCQGSTVFHAAARTLYYSGPTETSPLRSNMTLWGLRLPGAGGYSNITHGPWAPLLLVDAGPSAYSSLSVLSNGDVGLLYERSNATWVYA